MSTVSPSPLPGNPAPQLHEQYRPREWADVVGQDKTLAKIDLLRKRGLAGRSYWLSGQSGTGKSTIARLIASEIASEWCIEEVDATDLSAARVRELENQSQCLGLGDKSGRAYIVNESHGLNRATVRQLLTTLERVPGHVVWIFTTTIKGQEPDLRRWAEAQNRPVRWYRDKFTGKTMDRPGWKKLEADIRAGKVSQIVCWRLDRLGRTAKGLTALQVETIRRLDESGESVAANAVHPRGCSLHQDGLLFDRSDVLVGSGRSVAENQAFVVISHFLHCLLRIGRLPPEFHAFVRARLAPVHPADPLP